MMLGTGELQAADAVDGSKSQYQVVAHQSGEGDVVDDHGQVDAAAKVLVIPKDFIRGVLVVEGRNAADGVSADGLGMLGKLDAKLGADGPDVDDDRYAVVHALYDLLGKALAFLDGHQEPLTGTAGDVQTVYAAGDQVLDKKTRSLQVELLLLVEGAEHCRDDAGNMANVWF